MMGIAEQLAERGTCDRLSVGALIARDSRIISTGYNGNVSGMVHCHHPEKSQPCTTAVHAEANAIVFAARHGVAVEGTELFTTHLPCLACAKLIVNAGIRRVTFKNDYRLREGIELLIVAGVEVFRVIPESVDYARFQVTR